MRGVELGAARAKRAKSGMEDLLYGAQYDRITPMAASSDLSNPGCCGLCLRCLQHAVPQM